jgi:hypothetical protein
MEPSVSFRVASSFHRGHRDGCSCRNPNTTWRTALNPRLLSEHQRIATSGARAVLPFHSGSELRLAIPQLALDVADAPASMNGGDSDTEMLLYRWADGKFIDDGTLAVPGGEDAIFFQIGNDEFLATASVRTGAGPYDLNANSVIYRRDRNNWERFQEFRTFAARQWHFFSFADRFFIALAQGVTIEGAVARHPRHSCIFEWNGSQFAEFQTLSGGWGYNWQFFELDGRRFLGYADHTSPSGILVWDGTSFAPFQQLCDRGGRAFQFFFADGQGWLAFANLTGESLLYRWCAGRFVPHQSLGGPGSREFALIQGKQELYIVKISFITGSPAAPTTNLTSCIYQWHKGQLVVVEEFATSGGTDAAAFLADGSQFLAVSNSLSSGIRFREDTVIYRLNA